jgi:hypothetical protein
MALQNAVLPAGAFAITPSDANRVNFTALYVGVGGDVALLPEDQNAVSGAAVTFKNAPSGSVLPIQGKKVLATGTTATNILGLR